MAWQAAMDPLGPPIAAPPAGHSKEEPLPLMLVSALTVAAHVLELSVETRFTAAVLLHRHHQANPSRSSYSHRPQPLQKQGERKKDHGGNNEEHLLNEEAPIWVVMACLFLACKTEEEPRRLRDVINCAHMISFDNDETGVISWNPEPPELNEEYWKAKHTLVLAEQRVLRWLAFDVMVPHPHRAVVLLLKGPLTAFLSNHDETSASEASSTAQRQQQLVQGACRRLNDAIFHVEALQHPMLLMACAAIILAAKDVEFDDSIQCRLPEKWWRRQGIEQEDAGVMAAVEDLKDATDMVKQQSKSLHHAAA